MGECTSGTVCRDTETLLPQRYPAESRLGFVRFEHSEAQCSMMRELEYEMVVKTIDFTGRSSMIIETMTI